MKILSYGCARYKAFKEQVTVELRPLTLFFGKNNSGKSALLHLSRLLLRTLSSRHSRGFPLSVEGLAFGRHFHGLIHGGDLHGSTGFSMALEQAGKQLNIQAEVQNIHDNSRQPANFPVVSRFHLQGLDVDLDWTWEPVASEVATYQGIGKIPFRGLFPDLKSGGPAHQHRSLIDEWRNEIALFEERLEHLGPQRAGINWVYNNEKGGTTSLDYFGTGAVNRVAQDGTLLTAVGAWYQQNMEGWRFGLERSFDVVFPVLMRGNTTVNLADGGQGMQSLLPIVVQQLANQREDQKPFLNLIEEPELHLHAAAHAPLGDLFLNTAKTGHGQVIVETHSENLLLRIRRRIAEGENPSLVALYWIEDTADGSSRVRPIEIKQNGAVDWWPEGVFSEGYQEVRHMRRAALSSNKE
ncbi:MAG: AAA family ATPase [Magnetococcales bacterium]|nr:AAA family ATPase [Magnetococcales bacterium]